jgi:hypothetical protein
MYTADTWRLVAAMLCRYGMNAAGEIESRINVCLERRDAVGTDSWCAVLRAMQELLQPSPPHGERIH